MNGNVYIRQFAAIFVVLMALQAMSAENELPKSEVPDDHLAYFDLRGPVREVTEYALGDYSKTVWSFDRLGRLTEYRQYGHPFAGDGGCVFRLMAHYRYAYDKNGKIIFLYTYDEEYNLVDEYDDVILELFPPKIGTDAMIERADTLNDSTLCYSTWYLDERNRGVSDPNHAGQPGYIDPNNSFNHYYGCHYDQYRNWTERVDADEGEAEKARVRVREISYYTDAELLGLYNGVKMVTYRTHADGSVWESEYQFNRKGFLTRFQSYRDREPLYDWKQGQTDCSAQDLIVVPEDNCEYKEGERTILWWGDENPKRVSNVQKVDTLPEGCNEESAFDLIFNYAGYVFQGSLWPMHDGTWIVLSYWCLDEEETIMVENEEGEEVPAPSLYKDPFQCVKYPLVPSDSVSFGTRNYGGQVIPLYASAKGSRVKNRIAVECSLHADDADPVTRRVLCHTDPTDAMWGEPQNDDEREWKHPYVKARGWIDEEWICANLLTTCP